MKNYMCSAILYQVKNIATRGNIGESQRNKKISYAQKPVDIGGNDFYTK